MHWLLALCVVAGALSLVGCGGGGGPANPPAPAPPQSPTASPGVSGTIDKGPSVISGCELTVTDAGNTIQVAQDTTACVKPPGGGKVIPVPFSVINNGRGIKFGQIPLKPGMNIIELKAKKGYAIAFVDSRNRTVLFLGRIQIGIEMLADGTVIAPTSFELRLPGHDNTNCDPQSSNPKPSGTWQRQLIARGLSPGDYVRAKVIDRYGGMAVRDTTANDKGVARLNDYAGGITANNLSGPNSLVGIYFAKHKNLLP